MDAAPETWMICRMDQLLRHPPRVAGVNRYPFARHETVGPRANGSCHLCFVVGGRGDLGIAGRQQTCVAGDLLVLPWGRLWTLRDGGNLVVLSVHLRFLAWTAPDGELRHWGVDRPGLAERGPAADPAPDLGCGVLPVVPAGAAALAEQLLAVWLQPGAQRAFHLRALAAALVALLRAPGGGYVADARHDAGAGTPATSGPADRRIAALLHWLQWSTRHDLSCDELAQRAGLGRSAFGAAFKAATGLSPARWLMARRLGEAQRLLTTTRSAVATVGERVGFSDPFHFSRCFQRRYGMSPRQTRQLPAMERRRR